MANILVIDDDIIITKLLSEFLKGLGHKVTVFNNPIDALLKIQTDLSFELIFCDVSMPQMSGFDLYQKYKSDDKKHARFVLMSGQIDLMNAQLAYNLGVDELIMKPFDFEILKLVVQYLLEQPNENIVENELFIATDIDDLMSSSKSQYNLYLKINKKYVCVTKVGQEFASQRLKRLSDKGVKSVYLTATDFAKYTDFQFVISSTIKMRPIDSAKKTIAFKHLIATVSKNSLINTMSKESMLKALDALENYSQIAFNHAQLSALIISMVKERPDLAERSSTLAVLSSAVAELWQWSSPKIQSRIVFGALLCDIGLKNFPHLQKKDKINFTKEETIEYEEHPMRSFKVLSEMGGIPDDVLQIALQHHENGMGCGFPQKISKNSIHSFAKLIHGVNEFLEILSQQKEKIEPLAALNLILKVQRKIVSEQVLKSLYLVFNLPVPKELEGLLLPDKVGRLL